MVDLFCERDFSPAIDRDQVFDLARQAGGCFGLYQIHWVESLLAADGDQLFCHFCAPDTESLRMAFRQVSGAVPTLWAGTVHTAARPLPAEAAALNPVMVTRHFTGPVELGTIQAIEDAGAWCLETRNVHFERTFFALDGRRMACLYRAPDAESVRAAQRQAGMPFTAVWPCLRLTPLRLKSEV